VDSFFFCASSIRYGVEMVWVPSVMIMVYEFASTPLKMTEEVMVEPGSTVYLKESRTPIVGLANKTT
jgi:hypothetical protein